MSDVTSVSNWPCLILSQAFSSKIPISVLDKKYFYLLDLISAYKECIFDFNWHSIWKTNFGSTVWISIDNDLSTCHCIVSTVIPREQAGPTSRFSPLDYSALANTIRHYNDFFQQLKPVHISQAVLTIISLELVCREFVHTNPTGSIRDCATL